MNSLTVHSRAYAKINLALDITGRRADGYHLLDMVCETVSLFDDIYVSVGARGAVTLTGVQGEDRGIELPGDADNLMYRAALLMRESYGIAEGVDIGFVKRIPVEAGLGGGSSDAAAVMRAIDRLFGLGAGPEELESLGLKLGADVPFFVRGGCQRVRGIGEKLERLKMRRSYVLLAKPALGMDTASVYRSYDLISPQQIAHPDIGRLIETGDHSEIVNVLEIPASARAPIIGELHELIASYRGALAAAMTGSGSAVFGIFPDPATRDMAAASLEASALAGALAGVYRLETVDTAEPEEICDT